MFVRPTVEPVLRTVHQGANHGKIIIIAAMGLVFESRLRKSARGALFRRVLLGSHKPLWERVPRSA